MQHSLTLFIFIYAPAGAFFSYYGLAPRGPEIHRARGGAGAAPDYFGEAEEAMI